MMLRTWACGKRDGTRCNSPAIEGYDGCNLHSRTQRTELEKEARTALGGVFQNH